MFSFSPPLLTFTLTCFLVVPSNCLTTFQPNCTAPSSQVNFVNTPKIRSTVSILWDCVLILLICVWTVQHPNVPPLPGHDSTSHPRPWKATLAPTLDKVKWMVIAIVLPEVVIAFSFQDWQMARLFNKEVILKERRNQGETCEGDSWLFSRWTNTHTSFANMGGFAVQFTVVGDNFHGLPRPYDDFRDRFYELFYVVKSPVRPQQPSASERGHNQGQRVPSDQRSTCEQSPDILPGQPSEQSVLHQRAPSMQCTNPVSDAVLNPSATDPAAVTPSPPPDTRVDRIPQAVECVQEHNEEEDSAEATQSRVETSVQRPEDAGGNCESSPPRGDPGHSATADIIPAEPRAVTFYLNAFQLYLAHKMKLIESLDLCSEAMIIDKNKSDPFVKGIAILKLLHLLLTTLFRLQAGLPISQLELTTVAFSLCMLLAYTFYWVKPQNVDIPILKSAGPISSKHIKALRLFSEQSFIRTNLLPPQLVTGQDKEEARDRSLELQRRLDEPIPNDALTGTVRVLSRVVVHYSDVAVVVASLFFGFVHVLAWWYLEFPSQGYRKWWLITSASASGLPAAFAIANTLIQAKNWHYEWASIAFKATLGIGYIACRIFLVFEAFHSLFYQPVDVFTAVSYYT